MIPPSFPPSLRLYLPSFLQSFFPYLPVSFTVQRFKASSMLSKHFITKFYMTGFNVCKQSVSTKKWLLKKKPNEFIIQIVSN